MNIKKDRCMRKYMTGKTIKNYELNSYAKIDMKSTPKAIKKNYTANEHFLFIL